VTHSHLGDRVTALVDGQLPHRERDRLLAHLAHCTPCRAAADDERRTRETLRLLPDPRVPPTLLAGLLTVPARSAGGDGGPPVPRRPAVLPWEVEPGVAGPAPSKPARQLPTRGPAGRGGSAGPGRPRRAATRGRLRRGRTAVLRLASAGAAAAVVGALALSGAGSTSLRPSPAPVEALRMAPSSSASPAPSTMPQVAFEPAVAP
jgi:hypothetical protein